jgi:hypothetical protein
MMKPELRHSEAKCSFTDLAGAWQEYYALLTQPIEGETLNLLSDGGAEENDWLLQLVRSAFAAGTQAMMVLMLEALKERSVAKLEAVIDGNKQLQDTVIREAMVYEVNRQAAAARG